MRLWGLFCFACSLLSFSIRGDSTPAATHLASPSDILARLDQFTLLDNGRRFKTPFANIFTLPLFRMAWLTQLFTDADWIGIQALSGASYRIDPGGVDDASNMFVYTCRGGWVDLGHVIYSALFYKIMHQGLKHNPLVNMGLNGFFKKRIESLQLYTEVKKNAPGVLGKILANRQQMFAVPESQALIAKAARMRLVNYYENIKSKVPKNIETLVQQEAEQSIRALNAQGASYNIDKVFYGFWAAYFTMEAGFQIERDQDREKYLLPPSKWTGNATSAWTLEDLPSDYYGVQMGAALWRSTFQASVISQMRSYFSTMFRQMGAVNLDSKTPGYLIDCLSTAGEVLKADANYYYNKTAASLVTHRATDSKDPSSPYNYTALWKKTRGHHCLCSASGNPY